MVMNIKPGAGGLIERNSPVPSEIDPDVLRAEMIVAIPEAEVMLPPEEDFDLGDGNIEITEDETGDTIVDFDPSSSVEIEIDDMDFGDNLAEEIEDTELASISNMLQDEFSSNKASRSDWDQSYVKGIKLLGFKYEERTEPFHGASSVTHPLLAEAAIQFQAQAFNELLPSSGPVKTAVMGKESPDKVQQAKRVKDFMNYYTMNEMDEYTPDMDQMFFHLPLAGSTFKKTYYDENIGRVVSRFVTAQDLVVPYDTTDLQTCPNITQVVRMPFNDLRKLQISGFYRDFPTRAESRDGNEVIDAIDEITGSEPGTVDYDCTILECHADLEIEGYEDLDEEGEPTGIKYPYIVTIFEDNGKVLSIRRNWKEDDDLKRKLPYFTHYKFLPGFGFYGLGLVHTIGGLSRAATSALRQLIDAGTLSNLPAGFKARGLRISDNDSPLKPGEFRDIDAGGGALRDSLLPLPYKGPDQTLFALLGYVVEAGQRFASITDLKVGDGNQNAAVGTTIAMIEQGTRVMSAVHKRMYYAMRQEFKILARVMSESLPQEYPYTVEGADQTVMQSDFDERVDIIPVGNPNIFSQSQRIMIAQAKMELASQAPELHNLSEVYRDMYNAIGVSDVDRIMKTGVMDVEANPVDPAQENINALDMMKMKAFEGQDHQSHIMAHLVFGTSPMVSQLPMVAMELQKHVMEHVKIGAEEQAMAQIAQAGQQQGMQQGMQQQQPDEQQMSMLVAQFVAQGMQEIKQLSEQIMGGGEEQQGLDPLLQLKQSEIEQRAQAKAADIEIDKAKLQLDGETIDMRDRQFNKRIASQENLAEDRNKAAMERELLKIRNAGNGT